MIILTKTPADKLTKEQLDQLNISHNKEWSSDLPKEDLGKDSLYVLLIENGNILASGYLKTLYPVIIEPETFSIVSIRSIISNVKGKGYGKEILVGMIQHLIETRKTGIGFCMPKNMGFYEKCGMKTDYSCVKQFVYHKGSRRIIETQGQSVFYHEGEDKFMTKVLSNPNWEVSVPSDKIW